MSHILNTSGEKAFKAVPKVSSAKTVGNQIMFEILTPQEILGTNIIIDDSAKNSLGAPQAYILEVGPTVDATYGLKKGDRVVLVGDFTPLPTSVFKNGRIVGVTQPHQIKAILVED